jgi:hypothetical protein
MTTQVYHQLPLTPTQEIALCRELMHEAAEVLLREDAYLRDVPGAEEDRPTDAQYSRAYRVYEQGRRRVRELENDLQAEADAQARAVRRTARLA